MQYPGEKFYPEGVRWDEPIETGLVSDLLEESTRKFADRPAIEFRERQITYTELNAGVAEAAAAYLRDGLGRGTTIGLFLGNTPDHPIHFFGALRAGARVVHVSPLDGEITLTHKLTDSGARVVITSNLSSIFSRALAFLEAGCVSAWNKGSDAILVQLRSFGADESSLKQIDFAATVHLAFDEF